MPLFGTSGTEEGLTIVIRARNEATEQLRRVQEAVTKFKNSNQEMLRGITTFGTAGTAAFAAFGFSSIKAAANMEQTRIAFETMLGSAEKADGFIREMTTFAKTTPFELTGVEQASKQLLAYGFAQEEVLPNLKALGDIAAGVGMDKLPNLILAFGQVRSATKLTGMELRQFTEAGVPLLEELTKVTGKSAAQIKEDMEGGMAPSFQQVQQAIINLTSEGGRFNDLMSKQAKSLGGMWINLGDEWDIFLREQGAKLLDFARAFVGAATEAIKAVNVWTKENPRLTSALFTVGGALTGVVAAAGALALILPKLISYFRLAITTLAAINPALTALGVAIGWIMIRLTQFADEVGGLGKAWAMTVTQMEMNFWRFVRGTLSGIDTVAQYIPFLNRVMDSALDKVNQKVAEAEGRLDALAYEGLGGVAKKSEEVAKVAPPAFAALGKSAEEAAEKIKRANDAVADTKRQLRDLIESQIKGIGDSTQQFAAALVKQEQKVNELEHQVMEEKDDAKQDELQEQLRVERDALEKHRGAILQAEIQVTDERRRAKLTDFERDLEDIQRKATEEGRQFSKRKELLDTELRENEAKRDKLTGIEQSVTVNVVTEIKKREKEVVASINTQISKYQGLAATAASAVAAPLSLFNPFGTQTTTPQLRSIPVSAAQVPAQNNSFSFNFSGATIADKAKLINEITQAINRGYRAADLGA
jgi:tape measure domain-containing protein